MKVFKLRLLFYGYLYFSREPINFSRDSTNLSRYMIQSKVTIFLKKLTSGDLLFRCNFFDHLTPQHTASF